MRIVYKNLVLRDALPEDAGGFPNGLGTTSEAVASSLAADTDLTRRRLILECAGKPIGEMSYRLKGTDAEIGIKICDPSMREKGLGKQALSLLISHLFVTLGCGRIVLDTDLENVRAQHVYERLRFRRLRTNRDSWRDQLGRPRSSVDYELLPGDFVNFAP